MSAIAIRRLSPASRDDYRKIRLEALRASPEAFGSTYELEAQRPIEAFAERLAGSIVFGAYLGDEIVGMVGIAGGQGPKERHKAFLWGMYVRADMTGKGVGRALVEAILEAAPAGIEQITLAVVKENAAAQALYQRLGFTVYGAEPRALKIGDHYADEILMVKFLWATQASEE
jgi:ribosomal protein S18 acetylase RimI-like enzyme